MWIFDRYTIYARIFPSVIAIAPALALAAVVIAWNVARRRGRKVEPKLFKAMGGLPSTTMLRHRDNSFDQRIKQRLHLFLSEKLREPAPTVEQETSDPASADEFYIRAGIWLRENTRDQKKFGVLFAENASYGFRRNIYGLKWSAFALNALIVIGCVTALFTGISQKYATPLWPVFVIAALHAAYLAFLSTRASVIDAARLYARQLLLSAESLYLAGKLTAAKKSPRKKP